MPLKWVPGLVAAALACSAVGASTSRAQSLTLSSQVNEDNGATTNGKDQDQSVYLSPTPAVPPAPTLGPGVLTTAGGYNFTGQDYTGLTSITSISVTLTMQDGNSDLGDFDYNHLRLALNGIDTGLILNGFRGNGLEDTFTFSGTPANAAAILTALQTNGTLAGTVTTDNPNDTAAAPNEIFFGNDSMNATTTLEIVGVPEPATDVVALLATFSLAMVMRKRSLPTRI